MKNKIVLLFVCLFSIIILCFIYTKLTDTELSLVSKKARAKVYKKIDLNVEQLYYNVRVVNTPTKDFFDNIEQKIILPKIEVDQEYVDNFLQNRFPKDVYAVDYSLYNKGAFKYLNGSIKAEKFNLTESQAIELGKKLLLEMNLLPEDAIVKSVKGIGKDFSSGENEFEIFNLDKIDKSDNSYYLERLKDEQNKTGYYCIEFLRSYNGIPIDMYSPFRIQFNKNGIRLIYFDWDEVRINNSGIFKSPDEVIEEYTKNHAEELIKYLNTMTKEEILQGLKENKIFNKEIGTIYIETCFSESDNNEYNLSFYISNSILGYSGDDKYIDLTTGGLK